MTRHYFNRYINDFIEDNVTKDVYVYGLYGVKAELTR
jgi:hypothetical protein